MKKRIFAFTLIICILLTACGKKTEKKANPKKEKPSSSQSETTDSLSSDSSDSFSSDFADSDDFFNNEDFNFSGDDFSWDFGSGFRVIAPLDREFAVNKPVKYSWKGTEGAKYTLTVFSVDDKGKRTSIYSKKGIEATSFSPEISYKVGAKYAWKLSASINGNTETPALMSENGNIFEVVDDPAKHPANINLDFKYKNIISEKVLKNYLSRSMTLNIFNTDRQSDDLRMVFNVGAKYIGRAYGEWIPLRPAEADYDVIKAEITAAHEMDPDLIFEACIYETTAKAVESTVIPEWVFKAYGQKPVKRTFRYAKMLYDDDRYLDKWGTNISVPDLTKLETQMFFYYKACSYMDMGIEAFHMGQMNLMTELDKNNRVVTDLFTKIREYAKKNSRRNMVLINAHTHGELDANGNLLYDFHIFPTRIASDPSHIVKMATKNDPQETYFEINTSSLAGPIYLRSLGGKTPSGWTTNHLPYYVELDNYDNNNPETFNQSGWDCFPWGYDEISWFANQYQSYRHKWLDYAYDWVNKTDPQGYFCMPGSRAYAKYDSKTNTKSDDYYHANNSTDTKPGFGDEDVMRQIFINSAR